MCQVSPPQQEQVLYNFCLCSCINNSCMEEESVGLTYNKLVASKAGDFIVHMSHMVYFSKTNENRSSENDFIFSGKNTFTVRKWSENGQETGCTQNNNKTGRVRKVFMRWIFIIKSQIIFLTILQFSTHIYQIFFFLKLCPKSHQIIFLIMPAILETCSNTVELYTFGGFSYVNITVVNELTTNQKIQTVILVTVYGYFTIFVSSLKYLAFLF